MRTLIVKDKNESLVAIPLDEANLKELESLQEKAQQGENVIHTFLCYPTTTENYLENHTNARPQSVSVLNDKPQTTIIVATTQGIVSADGSKVAWTDIFEVTSKTMGFFVIEPLNDLADGTTGEFTYMTVEIDPRNLSETQQWQAAREKINTILKEQGREEEVPIANRYI